MPDAPIEFWRSLTSDERVAVVVDLLGALTEDELELLAVTLSDEMTDALWEALDDALIERIDEDPPPSFGGPR